MTTRFLFIVWFALAAFVSGCGGNSESDSSSTATVPTITTQPTSQSVTEGASVSFTVVADGTATLTYQWRKGGTSISGATSATYSISAVASSDAGSYDVVVTNSAGSVTSSAATLTVTSSTGAPTITTQPASQSVATGGSVTFTVVATGNATLTYQWRKDSTAISGATASSYTISSVATTDAGSYDVVVTNSVGSVTSSAATLSVTTTTSGTLSADVYTAATTYYNTLSTTQQTATQVAWSLDAARKWSNLPSTFVARNGVKWGDLSTAQKTAARSLIATALSSAGNTLHIGMQAADDYLAANGGGTGSYGAGYFYIAFLGTPSTSGFWMLQLTGHHLTYNIAFNGSYKSPTPLFLGVEPKGSFTQSGTTYDPMAAQRTAMSNLGAALTSYSGALLSGTYSDILFGANGTGSIDGTCPRAYSSVTAHGLLYSSLSSTDQALVQAAIKSYVNTQATEFSDELLAAYLDSTALASTYVAYTGDGTVTTKSNYFRIEGPRVWIEFSVPGGVIFQSDIHYHTIWRDKYADYGGKCIS